MASKGVPKKPKRNRVEEPVVNPYQLERLKQCMKNSARLKELGLPDSYAPILEGHVGVLSDQNQSEDLESDHVGGVKFRPRKRVYAEQMTPKVTRSRKSIAQQDASLTPSDIYVPPTSQANESHTGELVGNLDDHRQAAVEGGKSAELDNTHMTTGSDAVDRHNQHNHMDNGDGFTHHDDNILVADGITQRGDHNQITNEGGVERRDRGNNMGLGLQRLNRARRGKLQVVITEGNIRPVVPLVAAKFASECNIIVRNHVPILPHWKLYKREPRSRSKEKEPKEKEPTSAYIDLFLGKLKAKFDINIEDETVEKACIEMMKSAVRQQRYRLKQDYFDPFPLHLVTKTSPVKCMTNEQWLQLLESWKSPKKIEMCQKNKDNRGNVKYHHTTGSRAYMVHVENLDDKCNEEEPNALDLFKVLHYSKKKKCYTPAVQEAITRMENKLSTTQGENPKSAAQVVAEVLAENTKKNQFLQNVGFQNARSRSSEQSSETELVAEKRANAELREQVADLKRSQFEMAAKIDLLLSQNRPS